MSYDIYSYRPTSIAPNPAEAQAIIEAEETGSQPDDEEAQRTKQKIAEALIQHNPRLEPFKLDHAAIAKQMNISLEQAHAQYNYIELDPPESDLAIQLTVYSDHVSICIPYWYTGADADRVFQQLEEYLRVIRRVAGFFVYDSQTDRAFDPNTDGFQAHKEYDRIALNLPSIAAGGLSKKPWWKFW